MLFTLADNAGADIILQSSDNKKFYVHKCNLIVGSKFFATMLSLPQPETTDSPSEAGLPIIPMGEDKSVLSGMLPYFYPYLDEREFLHKRNKLSVMPIFEALCFVDKYEMHQLVQAPLVAALQYDTCCSAVSGSTALISFNSMCIFGKNEPHSTKRQGHRLRGSLSTKRRYRRSIDLYSAIYEHVQDSLESHSFDDTTLKEVLCLFQPRCPLFLHDIKARLLPAVARYTAKEGNGAIVQEFGPQDRADITSYRRQSALAHLLNETKCDTWDRPNCKNTTTSCVNHLKSDKLVKVDVISSLLADKSCDTCKKFVENVQLALFAA